MCNNRFGLVSSAEAKEAIRLLPPSPASALFSWQPFMAASMSEKYGIMAIPYFPYSYIYLTNFLPHSPSALFRPPPLPPASALFSWQPLMAASLIFMGRLKFKLILRNDTLRTFTSYNLIFSVLFIYN